MSSVERLLCVRAVPKWGIPFLSILLALCVCCMGEDEPKQDFETKLNFIGEKWIGFSFFHFFLKMSG
jgi:hypothetical protein